MVGRKTLPHEPPHWVDSAREIWFITINCQPRGANQLANAAAFEFLVETMEFRVRDAVWFPLVFLAMPDHCHTLVRFPSASAGMTKAVRDWKRWCATKHGIQWQSDFFDHRLRRDESYEEKMRYILENPVRAGLADHPEQ